MSERRIYLLVGTTAELIKLMPVMKELRDRNIAYRWIASGQNDVRRSELLGRCGAGPPDIALHTDPIRQTVAGLAGWFASTLLRSRRLLRAEFAGSDRRQTVMVVHGDTVSTLLGAMIARHFRLPLAHIEAGLRSFSCRHPFPEEITRVLVSRLAAWHFCPTPWAATNLAGRQGRIINTGQNTLFDSLQLALQTDVRSELLDRLREAPYFVFVVHRQENIYNGKLLRGLIAAARTLARQRRGVFILHAPTRTRLEQLGLLGELQHPNLLTVSRLPYFEFARVLDGCEFIVTDGGSNQEEAYYLGKPCLLLRERTERQEGLGENVSLWGRDPAAIAQFAAAHARARRPRVTDCPSPSRIIVNALSRDPLV